MENNELTHITDNGVHMVDVGPKPIQTRIAIAKGSIFLNKQTIKLIENDKIKKGNVLTVAQIAAIYGAKKTSDLIPLSHSLNINNITIKFEIKNDHITSECIVKTNGKTGVEMEAITGVSICLLTIWDMVKSVEKDENGQYPSTKISDIKIIKKEKI